MKHTILNIILIFGLLILIAPACNKENVNNNPRAFNLELLKGGTWLEYKPDDKSFTPSMKFRFYGDSRITFSYLTSVYPSVKYDSLPNGNWKFIYPDTLRLYDRPGNFYGNFKILKLDESTLCTKMTGYADNTWFIRTGK